ncbi:MAG: relaxase/mobilization nuclease domain-containing protein [Alphaproteobacteria bacterium]|nr:relaxase/mobilization nuclease domain-containing protein [Alphaproteobacteria bacterium]
MILVGNQRGGARELAQHLLKEENERVIVHEIRGFVSDDLHGAFLESYGVSRGTRCKQHLYSLSLNPPHEAEPTPELFEEAINKAEERLGLSGQPRAIVFHEKIGSDGRLRRHAHAVWCRIDIESMKAVQMSYDRRKLNDLGRELYLEHGWSMPRGFVRHEERDPRNYSLAEWQQAKRAKKDPARLKEMFQDCWAISDTQTTFAHALKERGYILAKGDRRGVVAVDHNGEVYAIARWVGIKTCQVADKVTTSQTLLDVIAARNEAAKRITDRLHELRATQAQTAKARLKDIAERRRRALRAQDEALKRLAEEQKARSQREEAARAQRIRTGWRGLLDRITGARKRTMQPKT